MLHRCSVLLYITIFTVLSLQHCWERQNHSITRPEVPRYTLTGSLVDMDDSNQVIGGEKIVLRPVTLLYDVIITSLESSSDSTGAFSIDSIVPGSYTMEIYREGYKVVRRKFSMYYADRVRTFGVPKPLISERKYSLNYLSENPRISWDENTLDIFGKYTGGNFPEPKIYFCEFRPDDGAIRIAGELDNPSGNAEVFFHVDNYFYAGNFATIKRYKRATAELMEVIRVNDQFSGLAYDGSNFWSVYQSRLQYRGKDLSTVNAEYEVGTEILEGLAATGTEFWTCNPMEDLVFKLDKQGKILGTYHPVSRSSTSAWIIPHDLNYSFNKGQLWISSVRSLYSFENLGQ